MASFLTQREQELTCPICRDIFQCPVFLSCSHSVCKACLQRWWTAKPTKECPVCNTRSSQDEPPINLALKNLCETFLEERNHTSPICTRHGEKLLLFCLEDEQLACLVCRDSEKHAGHKFKPIDEAAQCLREEPLKSLRPLKRKMEDWEEKGKYNYECAAELIEEQAKLTERQIKKQFKKLRQFLDQEEEARISAVSEEKRQKSGTVIGMFEGLNREMTALSDTIRDVEADDVSFIQNYKATVERVHRRLPDPPSLPEGALIDMAKHLGNLTFKVWDKMKDIVSYTPIILDPNTAHSYLVLSDDLTSVHYDDWTHCGTIPDVPERFDLDEVVRASEGFSSGSHTWDVEVGDNPYWELGALEEPLRKRRHRAGRHWTLELERQSKSDAPGEAVSSGSEMDLRKYTAVYSPGESEKMDLGNATAVSSSGSETELSVDQKPRRIRVHLDWERGELSFSDSDSNAHLHTFTHTKFTGRVFPYIRCLFDDVPLKVLTRKVCVSLENHNTSQNIILTVQNRSKEFQEFQFDPITTTSHNCPVNAFK